MVKIYVMSLQQCLNWTQSKTYVHLALMANGEERLSATETASGGMASN